MTPFSPGEPCMQVHKQDDKGKQQKLCTPLTVFPMIPGVPCSPFILDPLMQVRNTGKLNRYFDMPQYLWTRFPNHSNSAFHSSRSRGAGSTLTTSTVFKFPLQTYVYSINLWSTWTHLPNWARESLISSCTIRTLCSDKNDMYNISSTCYRP